MLDFFAYEESVRFAWDEFVLNHPYGSIHQMSQWRDLQQTVPGRGQVLGFGVRNRDNGKIMAVTFCVRMETGVMGTYWFYSARGPVFDPVQDREAGRALIHQVVQALKQTKAIFWRMDPYFAAESTPIIPGKWEDGIICTEAIQNYQPTDTLEIDLCQTDEEILADMKRKGRYNINLARTHNVTVQSIRGDQITSQDLQDFWRLNAETTSRDGFASHGVEYYEHFCKKLSPYAVLFFATAADGQRIATAISTFCGRKAIYYFGASTSNPDYRNLMAPYLLQWEMTQYAKLQGCTTYDFLGIAPEDQPDHPYAGISEFKWKFGGYRKTYDSGKEIILRPWWYRLYYWKKKNKFSRIK